MALSNFNFVLMVIDSVLLFDGNKPRMKISTIFIIILFPFSVLHSNVGIFKGLGHSIELLKSKDIQMLSEEIKIVPSRGRFLFDGSSKGLDSVRFLCKFKLKRNSRTP